MKNIFKFDHSILKSNKTLVKETKTVSLEASVLFYEKNIEHKLTIAYIVDLEKNILVESLYRIKSIKRKDVLFNDKKIRLKRKKEHFKSFRK